jgi:DNA-binding response OmpR family regulator
LNWIKEPINIAKQVWELSPQLVILDFSQSNIDSLKLCRVLKRDRRVSHIPVIILSSKDTKSKDIIKGLEVGAEDYIFKPLDIGLFLARLNVILRKRIYREEPEEILKSRNIVLNLTAHTVSVNNKPVKLTPKEFALLYFLMKRKGKALGRRTLIRNVWEYKYFGNMRTLNNHIQTLRKKLGPAGKNIESVKGIGYKLKS